MRWGPWVTTYAWHFRKPSYCAYRRLGGIEFLVTQVYTKTWLPRDVETICRAITSTYEHVFTFSTLVFNCPYLRRILPFPIALSRLEALNYNLAPTSLA